MSAETMQGWMLVLLAIIALLVGIGVFMLLRALTEIGRQQEDANKVLSSRDLGPVLHGLVEQTRDVNRQLANIDKRLEKLEALEKVQIATLTLRDETRPSR